MQSKRIAALTRTLHSGVNALPAPSGIPSADTAGDISGWHQGGFSPAHAVIELDAATGATVTIAGPVEVVGFHRGTGKWRVLGVLNAAATITLTAANGFAQLVINVAVYDHIQLRGGAISGGTVNVTATPIEVL